MELEVAVETDGGDRTETVDVAEDATVRDVLDAAGIDPATVIVEQDGSVVPLEAAVEGERLRVLDVIAGG